MFEYHQKALHSIEPQILYIVATPIGNLADITLHALAVLQRADLICAEDTRVTAQLLSAYGIQAKLISVREHNERYMAEKVISALATGQIVAQVSDAGTPAVCDPGARLVESVREAGFKVVPIVGASAVMAALSVAGVVESSFHFYGFLPHKSTEKQRLFEQWANVAYPVMFFESPHRVESTLNDLQTILPQHRLMLARELTKTFETVLIGRATDILAMMSADNNQLRGEMVLLLYPFRQPEQQVLSENAQKVMRILVSELSTKQAADLTAKITGENKKALYDLALGWKRAES